MKILITGGSGFIGTNLITDLINDGFDVVNMDIAPPLHRVHTDCWVEIDILDRAAVFRIFAGEAPEQVIHLAARTDCDENITVEEGYRANTEGTQNVVDAIASTPSVERALITSTQYVCGPAHFPVDDADYGPHTVYGQSKVITEKIARAANMSCVWTLTRPVNIWGPWHLRYSQEFLRVLRSGWYCHPGGYPVVRTYGYVGNVVWQMRKLLEAPRELVDQQVFYLGDAPMDVYEWVDSFSRRIRGESVRVVPRWMVRALGWCGDLLGLMGLKFPITSSRFASMTQHYPTPMERTFTVLGTPPYTLQDGVEQTVQWLDDWSVASRLFPEGQSPRTIGGVG